MSRPSSVTDPESGLRTPKMALIRVDFPAPFGPTTATISFGSRKSPTPRRIGTSLYPTVRSRASRSANLASQVGFDYRRHRADLRRFPFGDDTPLMHHDDAVASIEDDVHVMLDQKERLAGYAEALDQGEDLEAQRRVHASHGLVEQDERWLHHQDPCELHQFLMPAPQIPRRFHRQL